jgi:hypothetical protein
LPRQCDGAGFLGQKRGVEDDTWQHGAFTRALLGALTIFPPTSTTPA